MFLKNAADGRLLPGRRRSSVGRTRTHRLPSAPPYEHRSILERRPAPADDHAGLRHPWRDGRDVLLAHRRTAPGHAAQRSATRPRLGRHTGGRAGRLADHQRRHRTLRHKEYAAAGAAGLRRRAHIGRAGNRDSQPFRSAFSFRAWPDQRQHRRQCRSRPRGGHHRPASDQPRTRQLGRRLPARHLARHRRCRGRYRAARSLRPGVCRSDGNGFRHRRIDAGKPAPHP